MSTPMGEHDVCRHLEVASKPDEYRRMDTIPLATRVHIRHVLEGLKHQVGDVRNAMADGNLNRDGAIVDVHRMSQTLRYIKRVLEDGHG